MVDSVMWADDGGGDFEYGLGDDDDISQFQRPTIVLMGLKRYFVCL